MKSIRLLFGSEQHRRILEALNARYYLSDTEQTKRHATWRKADDEFQAYVKVDEADQLRKAEKETGEPQFLTLNIPYSYAMLMSAHTYWTSVFLSRDPVLQFTGAHGEPEMNVKAVEALMAYQTSKGKHIAPYYIWLQDAGRYGLGVLWNYWDKEERFVSEYTEEQQTIDGYPVEGAVRSVKSVRRIPGYEGGKVFNVRPFDYLPDPRVPLTDPQAGEFVGRKTLFFWNDVIKKKLSGQYIEANLPQVREAMRANTQKDRDDYRSRLPDQQLMTNEAQETNLLSGAEGYEMVVELIPKDWGLGSTEYPEKWIFAVVDKRIIVEARPCGLYHGKFPVSILESEIEGYTLHKRGMLDISRPLNDTLNWLLNSHYYNVRKSLEGEIVFDPLRISARDILDPKPGKRIRVTPAGYGQDIRSMIQSIHGTGDITKSHMQDSQHVEQMMQRVMGVTDNVMGMVNPGGRKSATEVRQSSSAAINRLKTIAEYFSATGFSSNAEMLLSQTQQLYKDEKKFRLAGDQIYTGAGLINVTPEQIAGEYDFVSVDGTLPVDRFAMVNMWTQLLAQLRNFPQVMQQHDITKIFEWVATLGGLKNIRQFRINMMPDDQLAQQAQQGNMLPSGGANGGNPGGQPERGGAAARGSGGAPVVPIPRQIPGVGSSG